MAFDLVLEYQANGGANKPPVNNASKLEPVRWIAAMSLQSTVIYDSERGQGGLSGPALQQFSSSAVRQFGSSAVQQLTEELMNG
jgi:hypothetical protein